MLLLLVAYSIGLVLLGWWVGRRVRHTSQFFVANRSLGATLIFSTFLAANIGAGSTVGATGLSYREGLAGWWWNGSAGLGSLVLAFWVGPRIWREAARHGFLTVGDFLEHHFGRSVRALAAALIWLGSLLILTGQYNGASRVLETVGGVSPATGALIAAVVMTTYFVAGGLLSSAWVNLVQLAVILAGFALAVPLALAHAGGWTHIAAAGPQPLHFWRGTGVEGWPRLFIMAPAFFLSPGLVQKAYGARDEQAVRRGVAWNGVMLMAFACAPVVLGLIARVLYPGLAGRVESELALPMVLAGAVPASVGALALAAVFSAEVSSADAVLFMLSTSGARDFYRGIVRPDATDHDVLRAARIIAVAGGILSYGLSFVYDTVVGALTMFYSIMVVTLFAPILGALVLPRAGRAAAFAAIVTGIVTLIATQAATGGRGLGWAPPSLLGLVASTAAFLLVYGLSALRPRVQI